MCKNRHKTAKDILDLPINCHVLATFKENCKLDNQKASVVVEGLIRQFNEKFDVHQAALAKEERTLILKEAALKRSNLEYKYGRETCLREFRTIQTRPGSIEATAKNNRISLTYMPHFYERENIAWQDPIVRERLIANRVKYLDKEEWELSDKEILRGFKISGALSGYSHFSSFWIKYFIEKYNIKSIYDPCAGWGQRLLGAHDIKYVGNDVDPRTVKGLNSIIKDFDLSGSIIYNKPAENFTPPEKYDAVFTCPPYFNIEEYTYESTSTQLYPTLDEWLLGFWAKAVQKSTVNCNKYFAFIINHTYKKQMHTICRQAHLKLIEETKIGSSKVVSHLKRNPNVDVKKEKGEYLLVYTLQ